MEGDHRLVVPLPPLDGAADAEQALVAARERELQQTLEAGESDCHNQMSTHSEPPTITGPKAEMLRSRPQADVLISGGR